MGDTVRHEGRVSECTPDALVPVTVVGSYHHDPGRSVLPSD